MKSCSAECQRLGSHNREEGSNLLHKDGGPSGTKLVMEEETDVMFNEGKKSYQGGLAANQQGAQTLPPCHKSTQ